MPACPRARVPACPRARVPACPCRRPRRVPSACPRLHCMRAASVHACVRACVCIRRRSVRVPVSTWVCAFAGALHARSAQPQLLRPPRQRDAAPLGQDPAAARRRAALPRAAHAHVRVRAVNTVANARRIRVRAVNDAHRMIRVRLRWRLVWWGWESIEACRTAPGAEAPMRFRTVAWWRLGSRVRHQGRRLGLEGLEHI